ncbi:MAG: UDP-3-O-(3-hydroxymyristoyl)glucosamine N-acyltransferase [Helicobacteraceae bacterium]|nr:UDP-3-O-(3-hydroxymyristoyl)glucosamine N-acyltransferase [Helicobacteraceae bacterium]
MEKDLRLFEILKKINIEVDNDIQDFEVKSLLPLDLANECDISYVTKDKYLPLVEYSRAGAILIDKIHISKFSNKNIIFVENSNLVFAYISHFFKNPQIKNQTSSKTNYKNSKIFSGAFIGENVEIGENCEIMPNVVICDNVKIGNNVKIYPNVVIYKDSIIGNNVSIHAGSVIGSDGFGYAHTKLGEHIKIEHFGNVIIEDDVEIGANVTIDRAVFESTIVKKGAKIDNLVQLGHNCVIGEHSILVSQVGFAGSTTTGRNVVCGGQVGTGGHIHIGDFVQVAGRGAVGKNLPPNTKWGGHPLMELGEWQKMQVKLRKLTRN